MYRLIRSHRRRQGRRLHTTGASTPDLGLTLSDIMHDLDPGWAAAELNPQPHKGATR